MKLRNYMALEGIKAPTLAHHLSVSAATVFAWCAGKSRPNNKHIIEIIKFTNGKVKAEDFA